MSRRRSFIAGSSGETHSIAFWDNRSCQHQAMFDYFPNRRYAHRVTVCGDRPFYQA